MAGKSYQFPKSSSKTVCKVTVDSGGGIRVNQGDTLTRYSCAIHNGSPLKANEFGRFDGDIGEIGNIEHILPFAKLNAGEVIVHIPSLPAEARDRMKTRPAPISESDQKELIKNFLIDDVKIDAKYAGHMSSFFSKTNMARIGIFALDILGVSSVGTTGGFVGGSALTGGLAGMGATLIFISGGVLGIAAFFMTAYTRVLKSVKSGFVSFQSVAFAYGFTSEIFDNGKAITLPQRLKNATTGRANETSAKFAFNRHNAKTNYLKSWNTGFAEGKKAAKQAMAKAASTRKMSPESYKIIVQSIYSKDSKQLCKRILLKLAADSNSWAKSYVGLRIRAEASNCQYPN